MSQDFEDRLGPEEREAFREMARKQSPPPFLEDRVVKTLKQANLLNSSKRMWRPRVPYLGMAAAAALVFFILGGVVGMRWSRTSLTTNSPRFMLVLRAGSEQSQSKSAEEVMKSVREYGNWAGELRRQGLMVSGEKLMQERRMLSQVDSDPVTESSASADPATIAGYFLIEAQDYQQAMRIAAGCPHLKYGGTIEVRQIERF